jgi:enoyl-[acyl-carrier protein] reductase/trans-2-enoyl-CoA reductase (NAD+)
MIIKPKVRGFICTTAHPVGCARHVQEQIDYVKRQPAVQGPKKALIIGASTGYGLASRIAAAFGSRAATLGVFFERPASDTRTATAGWYNTAAFERAARAEGLYAKSINGDAFSNEIKQEVIRTIREDLGKVDLVVYSLASPRRTQPVTGETFSSVLKPIGSSFTNKTIDIHTGQVSEITLEPATEEEIRATIAVMGGEDWAMWIDALLEADVLEQGAKTIAYSYIGPEITYPVYREGTIGRAKDDLEKTSHELHEKMRQRIGGEAYVSVNKALVTQSSAAIPVVPLYISLLFKVMKDKGIHENTIEQIVRLYKDRLYVDGGVPVDDERRIRIDDLEMREDVQQEVERLWREVSSDNVEQLSDIAGYREEFFKLFGFGFDDVDYDSDVDPNVPLEG